MLYFASSAVGLSSVYGTRGCVLRYFRRFALKCWSRLQKTCGNGKIKGFLWYLNVLLKETIVASSGLSDDGIGVSGG